MLTLSDFNRLTSTAHPWQAGALGEVMSRGPLVLTGTSFRDADVRQWLHAARDQGKDVEQSVVATIARQGLGLSRQQFADVRAAVQQQWSAIGADSLLVQDHVDAAQLLREVPAFQEAGYQLPRARASAFYQRQIEGFGVLQERLTGKTKSKVNKWTTELLDNNAIIGNISVRLDPTKSEYELWHDDETGLTNMTIMDGILDCAVDSLSRIKAILGAADNPLGSFNLDTRFQVRIWLLDDVAAKKVATIYNTRGDKVNDSTAKYAYSETKEQEVARRLVNGSEHLGQDNIEVLSNSVSASSHKLTAFNTISRALETSWKGGPVTAADVEAQASWLISAWNSLVQVRPEFGKLSTPARQEQRKTNIASTAVAIYGLIGAMSTMYAEHVDPDVAFKALAADDGDDVFAWDNPIWSRAGVVTPTGTDSDSLGTRNSFPARRAATRVLQEIMGLRGDPVD